MKKILLILIVLIIVFFAFFFYKKNISEENINIGFISGLTGKYSSLGNGVLSGFKLAFEEIEYKINGKKVNIITKDDGQDEKKALNAINDLIKKDIKIVVGNTTSSMTKISIKALENRKDILLISATASSEEFSKKDDNFIRTQVSNSVEKFLKLSKYLLENKKDKMVIYYDSKNSSYSKGVIKYVKSSYEKNSEGEVVSIVDINVGFEAILKDIKEKNPNIVFIIANSLDTAKFSQFLRLKHIDSTFVSAGWAKEYKLIQEGGKAVEGMLFITAYDDNNAKDKDYLTFKSKYKKLYGYEPSVFATQAYETGKILIQALQNTTNPMKIKEYILTKKVFNGLQGHIIFDKYGDVSRDYFITTIKNSEYERIN